MDSFSEKVFLIPKVTDIIFLLSFDALLFPPVVVTIIHAQN